MKTISSNKARQILHDGVAHSHPLTDAQRKYFGMMSEGNTLKLYYGGEAGYTDIPFKYNSAWGGQFQNGGGLGLTGTMYARIGAPSNGKYAKKTKPSAQNGINTYYQQGLDFKTKGMEQGGWLSKYIDGGIKKDNGGQWNHPGEITEIEGNTMATHGYGNIPLYVVPDKGESRLVQPNTGIQKFKGATKFTEFPVAQKGWESNILNPSSVNSFSEEKLPQSNVVEINDPRTIRATTEKLIDKNKDLVSGKYNKSVINNIISKAKDKGLKEDDVWNLLSIGLQENGFNKFDDNLGHITERTSKDIKNSSDEYNDFLNIYQNKMRRADDSGFSNPQLRLQTYNGLGKIFPSTEQDYHGFKMKKIYGVDVPEEGIDMKKNPLYGRQIINLKDSVLKQNPEVVNLVKKYFKQGGQLTKLDQLTNFSNYNKPEKGGWLSKYTQ